MFASVIKCGANTGKMLERIVYNYLTRIRGIHDEALTNALLFPERDEMNKPKVFSLCMMFFICSYTSIVHFI